MSINLSAGTTFDVSRVSYRLGASQLLAGSGTVNGTATINGTVAPGPSIGMLTFSAAPLLNGTALMELNRTNTPNSDRIVIRSGTLNYGGLLTVTNTGPALQGGDSFQLFQAGSITGAFGLLSLPALGSNLVWNTGRLSHGVLSVVQTIPTNLVWSVADANLNLSWPSGYTGWRLQIQTNALTVGLSTNWVDVPGSDLTNALTLPIDATQGSVFYRLVYQ